MTYTVVGLLGRGGMAVVELAVDEAGREVARKRVPLTGSAQQMETARQRIRREAEILTSLRHPGILPLLAVEEDAHDVVLVMPRMVANLDDRVSSTGPLTADEVADLGRVLLDALATAHRQGIIHRDIKPGNVLFDAAGRPVLADFGMAAASRFTAGLTAVGTVIGTPGFIAPEQARGEAATAASDVFSLGATLAYALTGGGPFGSGDPFALTALAARGQVAPLPRSVPPRLRRPLTAMLDPRPERRPSAAAALGGTSGTQPLPAGPEPGRPRPARSAVPAYPAPTAARAHGYPWVPFEPPVLPLPVAPAALRRPRPPVRPPAPRRHAVHRSAITVAAAVAMVALAAAGVAWATTRGRSGRTHTAAAGAPKAATPTLPACVPLPYQPCGQPPAAFTDGRSCLPGHADFNGIAADGCEASSDYEAGSVLDGRHAVKANLVPASAVDTFRTYVRDSLLDFCTGELHVTLTAPPGVSDRIEVLAGDRIIASAISDDGHPATARAGEPSCFQNNSSWLTIRVSAVTGTSPADFSLTRSGGW